MANSQPFRFGFDNVTQKYGYIIESGGADTFFPFKSDPVVRTFRATMSYDSDSSGKWIYAYTPNISLEGYTPVYAGITSVNSAWNPITVGRRQVSVDIANNKVKIGWYIFSGGRGNAYIDVIVVYK